ncbi:hypothetical protein COCON_G00110510 [Conger conger]|uniref:Uncharacterized protein n=1 Tax=Conger conger TaxID=82655 RepID=A0A9Q1DJP3_CONCO|nr:hypothetical protein COCON_G00110510 [Conger conger]
MQQQEQTCRTFTYTTELIGMDAIFPTVNRRLRYVLLHIAMYCAVPDIILKVVSSPFFFFFFFFSSNATVQIKPLYRGLGEYTILTGWNVCVKTTRTAGVVI